MTPTEAKRLEGIRHSPCACNAPSGSPECCEQCFLLRVIDERGVDNERMRKALDAGVAKLIAAMKHWERCDEREAIQEAIAILLQALTPVPEAKSCDKCKGLGAVPDWHRTQKFPSGVTCKREGCIGTADRHPYRHPFLIDCPDCTTAEDSKEAK